MSDQLSRRVAALEHATVDVPTVRVVVAEIGETAEQALRREAVDTDAHQLVLVVVFG